MIELLQRPELFGFQYRNAQELSPLPIIRPIRAGYSLCKEDSFIQRKENYPYFTVHILFEGGSLVTFGEQQHLLTQGEAFFIFPGQAHTYYNTDKVGYLWIELEYAAYLDLKTALDGRFMMRRQATALFVPELFAILEYLKHNTVQNPYTLSTLCYAFIMKILESAESERVQTLSPLVAQAKQYIDIHFREHLPVRTLAERFHCSESLFVKQFRAQTHTSVGHYILLRKLEYAVVQLKHSDKSCAEIAQEINFYDAAHLNKMFKKHLHILPSDFRV